MATKYKDIKETCIEELSDEVLELAKQFLKDEHLQFEEVKERFEKSKKQYEELLEMDISLEFLRTRGLHVKNRQDKF